MFPDGAGSLQTSTGEHGQMYAETLQHRLFDEASPIHPASLCVIGVGDAGCRAVFEVRARSRSGARRDVKVVCIDTDSTSLTRANVDESLLLGAATLRGFGSGGDPQAAEDAAGRSTDSIRNMVSGVECVMIVAGLGGGTGSGAAPVVTSIARETGALVISVAIMPFDFEGSATHFRAGDALNRLKLVSDVVLETPGDGDMAGGSTLSCAMEQVRQYVAGFASTVASIATASADRSNVTAAYLRSAFQDGAPGIYGTADSNGRSGSPEIANVAELCVDAALAGRSSTCGVNRAIVLIESGPDLPVFRIASMMATVEARLKEVANGATPDVELCVRRSQMLSGRFRVSLIGTLQEVRRPLVAGDTRFSSQPHTFVARKLAGAGIM